MVAQYAGEMAVMAWINVVVENFGFAIAGMGFESGECTFWGTVEGQNNPDYTSSLHKSDTSKRRKNLDIYLDKK